MASIPVPPGFTVDSFLEAQELATNLRIVAGVIFALFVWDHILLIPAEFRLYRHLDRKSLRSPPFWCFVVLRYSPYLASISSVIFASFNISNCQAAASVSFTGVLLMQVASGGIFLARVLALLHKPGERLLTRKPSSNALLCNLLIFLYVLNIGAWIAVLPGYGFTTGPPTRYGSNCLNPRTYSWSALSYGTATAFDTLVLICTIATHRRSGSAARSSSIMTCIFRDGVLYFLFVTIANIIALGMNLTPASLSYYRSFATPFSSFAVVVGGERVFLNLRLMGIDHRKRAQASAGDSRTDGEAPSKRESSAFAHRAPATSLHVIEETASLNSYLSPLQRSSSAATKVGAAPFAHLATPTSEKQDAPANSPALSVEEVVDLSLDSPSRPEPALHRFSSRPSSGSTLEPEPEPSSAAPRRDVTFEVTSPRLEEGRPGAFM